MLSKTSVATETLRALHRIHRQVSDLKGRLRRGPNLLKAHEANIQRLEARRDQVQQETKNARVASDAKQGQLRDAELKIEKLKSQLNTAASNREYQALKDQIAAIEMANSVLADEILEGLETLDESAEKVKVAEETVVKARADADKVREEIKREEPLIHADLNRVEAELKECEAGLPAEFREVYNRLVQARGEDAMAPVRNEYCGGCNQHVPLNLINGLMLSHPTTCRSCGRLLYIPEEGEDG